MSARVPHRDSPAPWKVYLTAKGALLGVGDKRAGGVTDYQGGFWGSGANRRANMHLVAAAPELYNALAAFIAEADAGRVSVETDNAARAALRKARGEAL